MNLLFILPFCQHDAQQAVDLLRWIKDLSGKLPFDCALLYDKTPGRVRPRPVIEAATEVFQTVFDPFNVKVQNDSWPSASNQYFCAAARELYVRQEKYQAFWFFEADLLPLTKDWWSALVEDYEKQGKPHYGAFSPRFDAEKKYQGDHLQGHSIYRSDVWNLGYYQKDNPNPVYNRLIQSLEGYNASELRQGRRATAFDIYLWRDMIGDQLPDGSFQLAHASTLIQHAWRSKNYREENGEIRYEVESYYGQPTTISPEAKLVHGCKDGSLLQLMRRKLGLPDTREVPMTPPPVSFSLPKPSEVVTAGTEMAAKIRERCNALTPPEREALRERAMYAIESGETFKQHQPESLKPTKPTNPFDRDEIVIGQHGNFIDPEGGDPSLLTPSQPNSETSPMSSTSLPETSEEISEPTTTPSTEAVSPSNAAAESVPPTSEAADEIPESLVQSMQEAAEGNLVDLNVALTQPYPKKRRSRNAYLEGKPPEIAGALRLIGRKFEKCTPEEILEAARIRLETGKNPPVPKPPVPTFTREQLENAVNAHRGFLKVRAWAFQLGIDATKMKSKEVVKAILEKQSA